MGRRKKNKSSLEAAKMFVDLSVLLRGKHCHIGLKKWYLVVLESKIMMFEATLMEDRYIKTSPCSLYFQVTLNDVTSQNQDMCWFLEG